VIGVVAIAAKERVAARGAVRSVVAGRRGTRSYLSHNLNGGDGNDTLNPGATAGDSSFGGPGNDTIVANDGATEKIVDCGDGDDTVILDPKDVSQHSPVVNCEHRIVREPEKGPERGHPLPGDRPTRTALSATTCCSAPTAETASSARAATTCSGATAARATEATTSSTVGRATTRCTAAR